MIIIDSAFHQSTVPLTLCTIKGEVMATAFIIGPEFVKSALLPELNDDGLWILLVPEIQGINTLRINNKLYYESDFVSEILPGRFVLNIELQELRIRPHDS